MNLCTQKPLFAIQFLALVALSAPAAAHPGHSHEATSQGASAVAESPAAGESSEPPVTGTGDLRFRYNAELSELPAEIAERIEPAHGGFAKAPAGEIYFGLDGTGIIRISADLRTKSLLPPTEAIATGSLHNTTFVERDGGLLVLPDAYEGQVHVVTLEGEEVKTLGRPPADLHDYYAEPKNVYMPTDTEVAPNGLLYINDGYSWSKFVLTADLDSGQYHERAFGEHVGDAGQTPGKFSTNHGITLDPSDDTLAVADRERQWVQKFTPEGEFVGSIDTAGGNPCDIDFLDWQGSQLAVVGCLRGPDDTSGVVQLVRDGAVVSTIRPKVDLGLEAFEHIHNAVGVVREGKLYLLCYGWNPGCFAVLEHVVD